MLHARQSVVLTTLASEVPKRDLDTPNPFILNGNRNLGWCLCPRVQMEGQSFGEQILEEN